jgi:hypothetical protein
MHPRALQILSLLLLTPSLFAATTAPASQPAAVTLKGTAIPQVDHNAILDRTKYNLLLEVVDEHDRLARVAVKINDVSTAYLTPKRGAAPVTITGTPGTDGPLQTITPTAIIPQPTPIEPRKK